MKVKLTFVKDDGSEMKASRAMPMINAIRVLNRLEKVDTELQIKKALDAKPTFIAFDFVSVEID